MTYSLKLWTNPVNAGDVRVYINGTTRSAVYFKPHRDGSGRVVWSSKANDTPHKFQTGDHYGKVRKDGDAAHEVAEAFSIKLGEDGGADEWSRVLQLVADGIQVEG